MSHEQTMDSPLSKKEKKEIAERINRRIGNLRKMVSDDFSTMQDKLIVGDYSGAKRYCNSILESISYLHEEITTKLIKGES